MRTADAIAELERFLAFDADWDGYDAQRIAPQAVDHAKRLLAALGPSSEPYVVAPVPNGSVQIEWQGARYELEVECHANGSFCFLLVDTSVSPRTYREETTDDAQVILDLVALVSQWRVGARHARGHLDRVR